MGTGTEDVETCLDVVSSDVVGVKEGTALDFLTDLVEGFVTGGHMVLKDDKSTLHLCSGIEATFGEKALIGATRVAVREIDGGGLGEALLAGAPHECRRGEWSIGTPEWEVRGI